MPETVTGMMEIDVEYYNFFPQVAIAIDRLLVYENVFNVDTTSS